MQQNHARNDLFDSCTLVPPDTSWRRTSRSRGVSGAGDGETSGTLRTAGTSGRAAVRAAATTWAVGALGATRGAALKWSTARMRHEVVGRMIQLRTTWDAATRGAHPDALLVMSARAPDDPVLELQAGFNALVDALIRKQAPLRVRVGSASTAGTVKFAVTSELLERTIDRVVQLVVWHVDRSAAPTVPGRWCADCHILDVCPDGPGLQEIEVRAVVAVDGTDPELG